MKFFAENKSCAATAQPGLAYLQCLGADEFVKDIFLDSETDLIVLSFVPSTSKDEPLTIEDLSKVWTALTMPFRLGASYHVSVVQIQSRRQRSFPQPVGEPPPRTPADFGTPPTTGPRVFAATRDPAV